MVPQGTISNVVQLEVVAAGVEVLVEEQTMIALSKTIILIVIRLEAKGIVIIWMVTTRVVRVHLW